MTYTCNHEERNTLCIDFKKLENLELLLEKPTICQYPQRHPIKEVNLVKLLMVFTAPNSPCGHLSIMPGEKQQQKQIHNIHSDLPERIPYLTKQLLNSNQSLITFQNLNHKRVVHSEVLIQSHRSRVFDEKQNIQI